MMNFYFYYILGMVGVFMLYMIVMVLLTLVMSQGYLDSFKHIWYKTVLTRKKEEGVIDEEKYDQLTSGDINKPRYEILKAYKSIFLLLGVVYMLLGIISLSFRDSEQLPVVVLVIGLMLYNLYIFAFRHIKLWRELGTITLYGGLAFFMVSLPWNYDITFLRGELIMLIIMVSGLAMVYFNKATLVAYAVALTGIIAVAINISASWVTYFSTLNPRFRRRRDYNLDADFDFYDGYLSILYWLIPVALIWIWNKNKKGQQDHGIQEILFNILAYLLIVVSCIGLLGQMYMIGLVLGLTLGYLYLRYSTHNQLSIFTKLGTFFHLSIVLVLNTFMIAGDTKGFEEIFNEISNFLPFWGLSSGFHFILCMVIIAGLIGLSIYLVLVDSKERKIGLNLFHLIAPLSIVLCFYTIEIGGSYLAMVVPTLLGWNYFKNGYIGKDELITVIGAPLILQAVQFKSLLLLQSSELKSDEKESFTFILSGLFLIAAVLIIRYYWPVSNEEEYEEMPTDFEGTIDNPDTDLDLEGLKLD